MNRTGIKAEFNYYEKTAIQKKMLQSTICLRIRKKYTKLI